MFGKDHFKNNEVEFMVENSLPIISVDPDDFNGQLRSFAADTSYVKRFKGCELDDKYGIELFKFQVNKKLKTSLLMTDLTGKLITIEDQVESTHVAKIIKVGRYIIDPKYKLGDLILLPISDTVGTAPNPDYYMAHQYDDSNLKPVQDEALPQFTYRFVASLFNSAWVPPQEFNIKSSDLSTFAIYPDLIVGSYEL